MAHTELKKLKTKFQVVPLRQVPGFPRALCRKKAPKPARLRQLLLERRRSLSLTRKPVVLCIDDHVRGLAVRKSMLESNGFSVLTAEDGPTGLAIVRCELVDAVILDYRMPAMDGGLVAQKLRRDHPHVPILFLSACTEEIPPDVLKIVDGCIDKLDSTTVLISELQRVTVLRATSRQPVQQAIANSNKKIAGSEDLPHIVERLLPSSRKERRG
jgi:CheY-like chemotaxis protein